MAESQTPTHKSGSKAPDVSAVWCVRCHTGVAYPVRSEEGGTNYYCFQCHNGFSIVSQEEGSGSTLASADKAMTHEELRELALQHNIDAHERDQKSDVLDAIKAARRGQ